MASAAPMGDERVFLAESLKKFGVSTQLRQLWHRRRAIAVVELAAIAGVVPALFLESDSSRRFLAFYALARNEDHSSLSHVLGSPYALVWLRRIFDCIKVRSGHSPAELVVPHMANGQSLNDYANELLDHFGFLVAASMVRRGHSSTYALGIPIRRSTTLPVTQIHLVPHSLSARLLGIQNGQAIVEHASVIHLSAIEVKARRIVIDPFDEFLALEGREGASAEIGRKNAGEFSSTLGEAFAVLGFACPGVLDEIELAYYVVAPSLVSCPTGFPSGTTSTSLGHSAFSIPPSPAVLCEMFVHELSHSHLFAYQDVDPVLDPKIHQEGWAPENLYSPWRDDARPVNGLLHAVYVFSRVARMWLEFIRLNAGFDELARRRLAALSNQLVLGNKILHNSATWTSLGQRFATLLSENVEQIAYECGSMNLTDVQPQYAEAASIGQSSGTASDRQRAHLSNWRQRNPSLCPIAEVVLRDVLG